MAKFAVLIFAALAFQAASAGVHSHQRHQEKTLGDYESGLQIHEYPTGKFDALFGQLQTVSQDLTVYFQKALPNDGLVIKTLTWQSRELAQYIDTIIEKLQVVTRNYSGQVSIVLEQVISELRDVQVQFHQIAQYTTDVYAVSQLKSQFYKTVQHTVAQLEKLVRLIQTDSKQSQGELATIVKNVVTDFLYAFQNIYTHVQYFGVYGEQSPRQLVLQIQEITSGLTGYIHGITHFDAQRRHAIREYVQHVETIISRMQEVQGTVEIDAVFQQVYSKLRRVLTSFMQIVETESMENIEVIRSELIAELQYVAEAFEQFVQFAQSGKYQTFFFEILGDYLYAIQQLRMQIQSGYQSFYGLYQGGFYGKNEFQGSYGKSGYKGYKDAELFGKTGYQGLYEHAGVSGKSGYKGLYKDAELFGKTGYQGLYEHAGVSGKSGYKGLYKDAELFGKTGYQGLYEHAGVSGKSGYKGLYKDAELFGKTGYQGLYEHAGLSGKSAYQGLYQQAGLYGKSGYKGLNKDAELYSKSGYGKGFYGKYQGFAKYGQDLKQFEVQIQTIVRDLYQALQTVSFDDVTVRQTFVHLVREYSQQLEVIVERLHQYVSYNTETDVVIFQHVAQNLRQYVLALQQFYTIEYSATEFRTEFYVYVQKIATEFEKLLSGIEQTNGTFYTLVQNVIVQYLSATSDLYRHIENFHQIAQYGYGPYARQYYGDNYSAGQYSGKYFGGKYSGQQGQVFETPRELVNQIEYVARDLSATFQNGMFFSQQHAQLFSVQARHFAQIIKNVIVQLESSEHVDVIVQQVIYKLREVQLSFERLAVYNVFTNVHQLRAEFDSYIQVAVSQIKQLVLIAQEQTHGDFFYVIKNVLSFFLYGLHDIHHQIQQVAQYGQISQYGQQYGFAKYGPQYNKGYGQQFDQEYKFDKYSHGLLGLGQYGKGYGYGFQN